MTTLSKKIKVRCRCGSIIEVHPNEIETDERKTPITIDGDYGPTEMGSTTTVTKSCTCPCSKKEYVVISVYSSGGYSTGPGGYSNIIE